MKSTVDTIGVLGNDKSVDDPKLEAIKTRVRKMEEAIKKLKELQSEVEKQTNMTTTTPSNFPTLEEKMEADQRSIFVGNVYYSATVEELEQHFHGCGSINRVNIFYEGVFSWCNDYSDGLRNRSKRVRTPVALLRSLSGKYPSERYEPPYPLNYGLNSTPSVLQWE